MLYCPTFWTTLREVSIGNKSIVLINITEYWDQWKVRHFSLYCFLFLIPLTLIHLKLTFHHHSGWCWNIETTKEQHKPLSALFYYPIREYKQPFFSALSLWIAYSHPPHPHTNSYVFTTCFVHISERFTTILVILANWPSRHCFSL